MLTAMRRLYAAAFREMAETAVQEAAEPSREFREQRRRKRIPSDDQAQALQAQKSSSTELQPGSKQVPTRNLYTPMRNTKEVEERQDATGTGVEKQSETSQAARPPPIVLTHATKLIQFQNKIRDLVQGNFEFHNTRSGTRVVTVYRADFSAIKSFFQKESFSIYTFHPKSFEPIKAVTRKLPSVTQAEEIYEDISDLGFEVMSVKQMTSSRRSLPQTGQKSPNVHLPLPLYQITFNRSEKSHEIFKIIGLSHIASKVGA
jgi:hypothetical protein